MKKYKYFNLIIHILSWSVVLFFPYIVSSPSDQYKVGSHPGLYFTLSGAVHCIVFYINALFLFPKLLNRAYWLLYTVSAVLLIFLSYQVKLHFIESWFSDASQNFEPWHVLFSSVIAFIASVFYSVAVEKIRADKLQKENEAMQLEMELKFLRSQISPHFLFNVTTNLVSLARKKSDNLEASLLMLSELMRYMLYGNEKKITLHQEAQYLESYIALQKLRFERDVKITSSIDISDEEKKYSIEPMLVIPFVENAFKHGTGYVNEPAIDVRLTSNEGILFFHVKNKFDKESDTIKDEIAGIGLNNVRSRLKLLYPDKHSLTIDANKNLFSIHLTLNLL